MANTLQQPFTLIDLTHTLDPTIPTWNGSCGFELTTKLDYEESSEFKFRVQQLKMHAGIGTHMDAPSHCIPGGIGIDQIPLEQLLVPCVVIDVSAQAFDQYQVSVDEILAFEQRHGKIPEHALVIFYTGWEKFWHDPEKYRNDYHFPCLSKEVAQWLLDRNVAGMGIDTLSPDRPETGFWVHQLLLGAGKYIIENVANAKSVPATGAYSLALPIKAKDATEAPMRLVAIIFSSPVV